jgi:hypothetical protein
MHIRRAGLVALVVVAAGCSMVRPAQPPAPPAANQATVVFLGRAAGALLYDVSDGDQELFIGISDPDTKVGYLSPAGRRRFMVVGETADFLDAELEPGKTYYALVTTRPGWWAPRFSFRPVRRSDAESGREAGWIASWGWVEPSDRGRNYATSHSRTVHDKKVGNQTKHEAKDAASREKVRLDASDGI